MLSDANCVQPHHRNILEELCQAHILKAAKLFCKLQLMQAFQNLSDQISALKPCVPISWYGDLSSHSLAFISVPRRSDKAHKIVVATRKTTQCKVEFIKILESNNYYQKHTY